MKRDNDLIRIILFEAEESSEDILIYGRHLGSTEEDLIRLHHIDLLIDAGFFARLGSSTYRLTNQGHDYLAAIRDEGIWKKTKEGAAKVGGVTLGVMGELALAYGKQKLAEVTGLTL